MGLSRAQIIDQDPGHVPLFYRDLRDVGFLIFSLSSGEGPAVPILRQPCLGSLRVPWEGGWGWAHCELVFSGFCSLAASPGSLLFLL